MSCDYKTLYLKTLSTAPNKGTPYYETHSNYYETLLNIHYGRIVMEYKSS